MAMMLGGISISESENKEIESETHPSSESKPPEQDAADSHENVPSSVLPDDQHRIQGLERSKQLALAAAQVAADNGGQDIKLLDMTEHTPMFDYFVIATGSSRRQLHAMSEEIDHKLEDDLKDRRQNIDGYDESRWIVLDYATVVIHLFDEETRAYYSLESLWADATEVDLTGLIKYDQ